MSVPIEELLNRRTDLSTFVVHLTKDTEDGPTASQNLRSILKSKTIRAVRPMGWAHVQARRRADWLRTRSAWCVSAKPL